MYMTLRSNPVSHLSIQLERIVLYWLPRTMIMSPWEKRKLETKAVLDFPANGRL